MLRIFVSGKLTDRADAESGFPQCAVGLTQFQLFYNGEKGTAGTFFDESTEMRGAVTEMCSRVVKCSCAVILTEIIQDLRDGAASGGTGEDGFNVIFVISETFRPQHHQLGIEKGSAVSGVKHIFHIELLKGGADAWIVTGMKN